MQPTFAENSPPRRRFLLRLLLVVAVLALIVVPASAQPVTLQSGAGATGAIDTSAPLSFFVFSGIEGELITVNLVGLTPNFIPTLTILSPTQQPIATSTGAEGAILLASVLPADGNYSLLVGSQNNQPGEFAVRVDGGFTGQVFPMIPDEELRAEITPAGFPQVLSFDASTSGFALQLGDPFSITPDANDLRFSAQIVASSGGRLAAFDGVYGALTLIPAGAGQVFIVISGATDEDSGGVDIVLRSSVSGGDSSSSSSSSSNDGSITVQPTASTSSTSTSGGCALIAGPNGVNVRSGDSTNFGVVGQIEPNGSRAIIGRNANNSWYAISLGGSTGWVAAQVITLTGDCSGAPVLSAGSPPPQPTTSSGQPSATATATTAGQTPPTATTAGENPPATATTAPPTQAATDAPVAPPDSNTHRFDVHRDNGGIFNEVISYPGGDTSDRIEMVINLDQSQFAREVTIILSCNGTGTQYVRFALTNPNGQRFGCGESITARYSNESRTGYYYVLIEEGAAYVNYTLIATTRP